MGFDSRHLVLEFLAENRNLNIQQMTLVFFGKRSDEFLLECFKETVKDKIYVYHSKGTRLFWKEYGYDKLSGSIIELLLDTNTAMNLSKKDISFKLTEPYYFLDLRDFDFEYLSVIPVIENEELAGYALLYGYQEIEENKYPLVSLKRLFRNIIKNEIAAKYEEFNNLLAGKIGYLDFNNKVYLSKKLSEILKVDQKVNDVVKVKELINNTSYLTTNSTDFNNYQLIELEEDNRMLVAIEQLSKPKSIKEFTLFYIYNTQDEMITDMFKKITKIVDIVFPKIKVDYYKVSDNALVMVIGKRYLKKVINVFKTKLKQYSIIDVRNNSDINKNANLYYVVKYLEETKCHDFNYDDYKNYRLLKEEKKYS